MSLGSELHLSAEQLRLAKERYEEIPGKIDADILRAGDRASYVEALIIDIYRVMRAKVYCPGSVLRQDVNVWESFVQQRQEFMEFYWSALNAVEKYKEIVKVYVPMRRRRRPRCQAGNLDLIRKDKQVHIEERESCIRALSNFYSKFCAMLTILPQE